MPQSVPSGIGSEWTTAGWLDSVGATGAIAQVLLGAKCDDELQGMRKLADLPPDELAERLRANGLVDQLAGALRPKLRELKDGPTVAELHGKFLQEGGLQEYKYADLSAFFGGLEAQIGPPEAHVLSAMEREHTAAADSLIEFTTPDYGVTTTPRLEWWFVVESERDLPWPTEVRWVGSDDQRRRPMSLKKLDTELAKMSAELRKLGEPTLIREEGIGARMYTGPMCACPSTCTRGPSAPRRTTLPAHTERESTPSSPRAHAGSSSTTRPCVASTTRGGRRSGVTSRRSTRSTR